MNRFTKNILYILLYGIIFYLIEKFINSTGVISYFSYSYSQPIMVFLSIIRPPLVGGFSAALGSFLIQIGKNTYDWILILCFFINCASIRWGMRNQKINNGFFERGDISRFSKVQLASNLVTWWLIYPLLSMLISHAELKPALDEGFRNALGYFISDMLISTLFLSLYAQSRFSKANFYRN